MSAMRTRTASDVLVAARRCRRVIAFLLSAWVSVLAVSIFVCGVASAFIVTHAGGRTTAVASAVAGSTGGSLVPAGQLAASSTAAHLTTLAASGQTAVAVDQTSGLVAVFSEPGSGWSSGMQVAQLDVPGITAVTPSGAADLAVAVSGSTIVVGNRGAIVGANSGEGAAYVYAEPAGGWSGTIEPSAELLPSDGVAAGSFGSSVAVSGSTVVVSGGDPASVADHEFTAGKVYVFRCPPGGGPARCTSRRR